MIRCRRVKTKVRRTKRRRWDHDEIPFLLVAEGCESAAGGMRTWTRRKSHKLFFFGWGWWWSRDAVSETTSEQFFWRWFWLRDCV
ncbi:hypothetical protein K439DRAFT_415269 [Ramaria rubella]|nr:hypothetical protein K439DRAFT_415269 [Ramaria rubella]